MDGVEGRSGMWRVVARILFSVIVAIAATLCGFDSVSAGSGNGATAKPTLRIGSTNFTEQLIVAELYAQALEANGYRVERRLNLGNREIVAPALESGQVSGAVLDVFGDEPLVAWRGLLAMPNVICTPHVAGGSRETVRRAAEMIAEDLANFLWGAPLRYEMQG